jgi:predicted dehydrogenase
MRIAMLGLGFMGSTHLKALKNIPDAELVAVSSADERQLSGDRSGGGIFDLLIHDVDICLHLFGPPESLSAWGHEDMPKGIDILTAEFHYPEIGTVTVSGGWHHPKSYPFSMEYTVVADGGTIEFSSAGRVPTLYKDNGEAVILPVAKKDGYQAEMEYFVDCVKRNRQPEICPAAESSLAVKLTKLMVEARKRRGETFACQF